MLRISDIIDRINEWIGRIISYVLIITVSACMIEVLMRYVFNSPTKWSYEVEIFTCGTLYVLVGAYTLLHKKHVSVDLLYLKFSEKTKLIINLVIFFPLILIMAGGLAYIGFEYAFTSIAIRETSYTSWAPPIWPVKLMLPIGGVLLALQAIANFLRDLNKLGGGLK